MIKLIQRIYRIILQENLCLILERFVRFGFAELKVLPAGHSLPQAQKGLSRPLNSFNRSAGTCLYP